MPSDINTPEPPPAPNGSTPVWELVIEDMRGRDRMGRAKYGTPLQAGNGRDPLVDAYHEMLDLAVYLRQEIEERRMAEDALYAIYWACHDTDSPPMSRVNEIHGLCNKYFRAAPGAFEDSRLRKVAEMFAGLRAGGNGRQAAQPTEGG